jgi:hypothetical protein
LCLLFTAPHYFTFLRVANFKQHSYQVLLPVIRTHGIKYLSTDFSIAYVIYFLAQRKVMVSDTMGDNTVEVFYPRMRNEVDRVPPESQAYLFFSGLYPRSTGRHKTSLERIRYIRQKLDRLGKKYGIVRLKYYLLIIPEQSRVYGASDTPLVP